MNLAVILNNLLLADIGFSNISSDSIVITILGYSIVFVALVFLALTLMVFSRTIKNQVRKKLEKSGKVKPGTESESEEDLTGEVNAAIAMALSLHFAEAHDYENTVITMQKVQRPYSPWSSKIYGLRQHPRN